MIHSPTSRPLTRDALEIIPGGVNSGTRGLPTPVVFARAAGAYIYDCDDHAYLDYHAAFGPIVLGHNHPQVTTAVLETMQRIDLIGVGITDLEIALARKIVQHVPAAEQVLLCNTGSEANYHAIRLARAVTGRQRIIKFQGLYHGIHDEVLMNIISRPEMIGKRDLHSAGSLPETVAQTLVLPFNDSDAVRATIAAQGDQIAAIILEMIPHNIGCVLPKPEFLHTLRKITHDAGIILIFDEVITGFRHGLGGYQAIAGVTPDLTTMAKAIANGFPCAALAGRAALMEQFATAGGPVFFAGTYNGHPVGVAAALATIDVLEHDTVYARTFQLCDRISRELEALAQEYAIDMTVARYGSVFVPYFMSGPITCYDDLLRNDTARDLQFRQAMTDHGIFMLPQALKRNHISAAHTDADIDRTLDVAATVLRQLRG